MSLARLWRDQGKVQQAHELLGVAGRVGGVTVHCSSRVEHERRKLIVRKGDRVFQRLASNRLIQSD
jgi:hypothetical protein